MFEWIAGIVIALVVSPRAWAGTTSYVHPHVWAAVFLELALVSLPVAMVIRAPGRTSNRHVIALAQVLTSALLIHLTGGRIETHFHIFGSLAFLAFYRDWKVLVTATALIAADHLLRGVFLPLSVYGVVYASPWRTLEHAAWVIFTDVFLIWSCRVGAREMAQSARREAALEQANAELEDSARTLERRVSERTTELADANGRLEHSLSELHEAQGQLLDASRNAGKAEVATAVLHNVGNVLNSVNVAAGAVRDGLTSSKIGSLGRAIRLLQEHETDLPAFLTSDERGRKLPAYLAKSYEAIVEESAGFAKELTSLQKHIDHIKTIVAMQQTHAKASSGLRELLSMQELLDDALKLDESAYEREGVALSRDYEELPPVEADRHKIFQIVTNLLSNARQAMIETPAGKRSLGVSLERTGGCFRIAVRDTGSGIAPEVRASIFKLGFTTKKTGHGFGLHSAACLAQEMGGSLGVTSDGPGRGATFTLELPLLAMHKAG